MADFAVTVALHNEEKIVYTTSSKLGFPFQISIDELTHRVVERFNDWISKDKPYERADLELLGELLYDTLFPLRDAKHREGHGDKTIRELFEADYVQFSRQSAGEDRFRLTLELHEKAARLARFPWEFLFIPADASSTDQKVERGFFLAGGKNKLILTRFVPTTPAQLVIKEGAPIRILVVFSHPGSLPNIDSSITRDVIAGIKLLADPKNVEVRVEENITFKTLQGLLNASPGPKDSEVLPKDRQSFRPDILHFIGHGKPGALALMRSPEDIQADKDKRKSDSEPVNEALWHDATDIQNLFANHMPRLVFLHACESAQDGSIESFTNLARSLVYSKIPCVIAMQYMISNRDAGMFAKTFYDELRQGVPVDEAVRAGREALGQPQDEKPTFGDRRFGTPVVYFQLTSDQPLIRFPKLSEQQTLTSRPPSTLATQAQDAAAQEKRSCPRCGEDNVSVFCGRCSLVFKCLHENEKKEVCGAPIAKPLTNSFCTKCGTKIVQVPYDGPLVTRLDAGSAPVASPFGDKVVPFSAGKV